MNDIILDVRVVVFSIANDALQVLLNPIPGGLELPGIPVEADESLEDAAGRAIATQVDSRKTYLEQLYTYGDPERIAHQRMVSVVYFALIASDAVRKGTQPASGEWLPVVSLAPLAHDHSGILAYALRRLRYKLEYSAVGFQLLPYEFTLSELQHTYEIILGEKLDKRNFRRRILEATIIEETNHQRSGEGRPARLYRYRPDAVAEVKARRLFP
jgi:8-oxo-dGTP diphosphatase